MESQSPVSKLQCPACLNWFRTVRGRNTHLGQAETCRWYKKGKLRDLSDSEESDRNNMEEGAINSDVDMEIEEGDNVSNDWVMEHNDREETSSEESNRDRHD